ncbi:MAG TPA: molybdopterin-dependent oxidoreductase, partial [Anaerolineales bacterium]
MKHLPVWFAGLLGGLTAIAVVALLYLGSRIAGLPFAPYDIFDWMARHLPGALINAVIDTMVRAITTLKIGPTASTAKLVEQGIALTQFVIAGVLAGLILGLVARRRADRLSDVGEILGAGLWLVTALMEISLHGLGGKMTTGLVWLAVVAVVWGAVLGRLIQTLQARPQPQVVAPGVPAEPPPPEPPEAALSRRRFLYLLGAGSLAVLAAGLGLRFWNRPQDLQAAATPLPTPGSSPALPVTGGPAASPSETVLNARIEPAPGTRSEVTPNDKFYRIDIDAEPPKIDEATWRLKLGGLVDKPLELSLADLRSRPAVTQAVTLSCISNELGGDLISTSFWTGVPFKTILAEAGLKTGVVEIAMTAADGFYESVPLNEAMDERTMLVYAMNGQPLSADHGFPLRIYIPNHYGMKQPKWITGMEAIDHEGAGYWIDRGWSATAYARTTSVIDSVAVDHKDPQTGIIPVGGIAWAGSMGISKVEVQVDDGLWAAAVLRDPPLSPLTWVQWRYDWKSAPGLHHLQVRAYNGAGADANPVDDREM